MHALAVVNIKNNFPLAPPFRYCGDVVLELMGVASCGYVLLYNAAIRK